MIDVQVQPRQMEQLQQLGRDWIGFVAAGDFDRLADLCDPRLTGRLLIPAGLVKIDSPGELVAEYRSWFSEYSSIRVEASRVATVGRKLGIFYRFLLQDQADWYRIEQQLFCILKEGRVQQVQLLCSGFQAVALNEVPASAEVSAPVMAGPAADDLLEFMSSAPDTAATCAILTPMIRAKLDALHSGQVLEVRVNDPAAKGDVESWSRLSGNPLLKVVDDDPQLLRFFVKKK